MAALILESLKIKSIRLITNNPKKIDSLEKLGIQVIERIPIAAAHKHNLDYLKTKAVKMAHLLFEGKK